MVAMEPMTTRLWTEIKVQQCQPDESLCALTVPYPTFEQTLQGISVASKASDADTIVLLEYAARLVADQSQINHCEAGSDPRTIGLSQVSTLHQPHRQQSDDPELNALSALAFAICALRSAAHHHSGRTTWTPYLWASISRALSTLHPSSTTTDLTPRYSFRFNPIRSAQGFLAIPLCSLINPAGNIDELFRVHVWLPDGERGNRDLAIHSHQAFAHSWILAGQAIDRAYDAEEGVMGYEEATHAEYSLGWQGVDDERSSSGSAGTKEYKTHQTSSTVGNTGRYVKVGLRATRRHNVGMYYSIPQASFHATEVEPRALHATLFFFDAAGGFERDAPVLGPRDGGAYTHVKGEVGIGVGQLVWLVDLARRWEAWLTGSKEMGRDESVVMPLSETM